MATTFTGADSVRSYQNILRQIVYFNRKPAYFLNRAFKLSCSELNGRFTSNDYIQTVTVIHPKGSSSSLSQTSPQETTQHKNHPDSVNSHSSSHQELHPPLAAKAQVHSHGVDLKESRIKSVSGSGYLDSGLMDSGDAFGRLPSGQY